MGLAYQLDCYIATSCNPLDPLVSPCDAQLVPAGSIMLHTADATRSRAQFMAWQRSVVEQDLPLQPLLKESAKWCLQWMHACMSCPSLNPLVIGGLLSFAGDMRQAGRDRTAAHGSAHPFSGCCSLSLADQRSKVQPLGELLLCLYHQDRVLCETLYWLRSASCANFQCWSDPAHENPQETSMPC